MCCIFWTYDIIESSNGSIFCDSNYLLSSFSDSLLQIRMRTPTSFFSSSSPISTHISLYTSLLFIEAIEYFLFIEGIEYKGVAGENETNFYKSHRYLFPYLWNRQHNPNHPWNGRNRFYSHHPQKFSMSSWRISIICFHLLPKQSREPEKKYQHKEAWITI